MRAVLIDDEYYALQGLKMKLEQISDIEVVGMFTNGSQSLESIEELNPEIIFLDIEMPRINGLDLFSQIISRLNDVKIVFVTAYAQYAAEAFELNAFDYVVKPIEIERLQKTLNRLSINKPIAGTINSNKINIKCFTKMSATVNGKEINTNLRKKSEELLAYLLYCRGEFVSKERIMGALWPEADGDKAANNLYVAFYNLKRLGLDDGKKRLVSIRGKMRLIIDEIECDVFEFEKLALCCSEINNQTIDLAKKALELYTGMLFEENYYEWVQLEQVRLDIIYLDLLDKIIKYYYKENNIRMAKYFEAKKENV